VAAAQALEQDLEALELRVAPDESRRRRAGVRRVGVLARVQAPDRSKLIEKQ